MKLPSNAKMMLFRYGVVSVVFFALGCFSTLAWVDRLIYVDEIEFNAHLEATEAERINSAFWYREMAPQNIEHLRIIRRGSMLHFKALLGGTPRDTWYVLRK